MSTDETLVPEIELPTKTKIVDPLSLPVAEARVKALAEAIPRNLLYAYHKYFKLRESEFDYQEYLELVGPPPEDSAKSNG